MPSGIPWRIHRRRGVEMEPLAAQEIEIAPRYVSFNAGYAIKDIYDALVELITNCDDSYVLAGQKDGRIQIEIERHTKEPSIVRVADRAQGMDADEMRKKLGKIGERQDAGDRRGFMSRGAKDCVVLGFLTYESIKDGKYYKCQINNKFEFIPWSPPKKATKEIRERLGVYRGNGTLVTLETRRSIPQIETVESRLPRHYALRDIMREGEGRRVLLVDLNNPSRKSMSLISNEPVGEIVYDKPFEVPNYPGVIAHLKIGKAREPLEGGKNDKFRSSGISVKSVREIYERGYFTNELEKEPLAYYYWGELRCPYLRQLCDEYDELCESGEDILHTNPCLIIDPNRQAGLIREHPFMAALLFVPTTILNNLIIEDRKKEQQSRGEVESKQTKERLDKLAKAASRFMKDKVEELEEVIDKPDEASKERFGKKGVAIFPAGRNMEVGEIAKFQFRMHMDPDIDINRKVIIDGPESDCVRVLNREVSLATAPRAENTLVAAFEVEALKETGNDSVGLQAKYDEKREDTIFIKVVREKEPPVDLTYGIAFGSEIYRVTENGTRSLKLYARYPEIASPGENVVINIPGNDIVQIGSGCVFGLEGQRSWLEAEIRVRGRKMGAEAVVTATYRDYQASTLVKVTKERDSSGIPLRIELSERDTGHYRAIWGGIENSNVICIGAKHPAVARYLGPPPRYLGQEMTHFKILLAEIVAEKIVGRILENSPEADEVDDVDTFYYWHNKFMTDFLPLAHKIMLTESDLKEERSLWGTKRGQERLATTP
jgi:hypothetical protein